MALRTTIVLLQTLASLVSTATLPTISNQNGGLNLFQLRPNTTLLSALPLGQASSVDTNLTVSSEAQCHSIYGSHMNPESCRNAIRQIPRSTSPLTFGWRDTGHFDVILPYIWVSEDGMCSVFVSADTTSKPDTSSFAEIAEAADKVRRKCVENPSIRQGGIIDELGRKKELNVVIVSRPYHVDCFYRPPTPLYTSCRGVLDSMPFDLEPRIFGPAGRYSLPFLIPSSFGNCEAKITTDWPAESSITEWGTLFTAIAQVNEICVGNGKSGRARKIGNNGYLSVTLRQSFSVETNGTSEVRA